MQPPPPPPPHPSHMWFVHTNKHTQVTELAPLAMLPVPLLDSRVLAPMRLMVGGTLLAAALAVTRGWAINLGGGMHHAHHADGSGWWVVQTAPVCCWQFTVQRSAVQCICMCHTFKKRFNPIVEWRTGWLC